MASAMAALTVAKPLSPPTCRLRLPLTTVGAFANSSKLTERAPVTGMVRRGDRLIVKASSSTKERVVARLTAAALAAAMVVPDVAEAVQPGISPSLKNFLLSIVAGGVVLGVLLGAIIGVANFDPVKRS